MEWPVFFLHPGVIMALNSSQQCAVSVIMDAELLQIKQSGFPCQFSYIMLCEQSEKLLPP